MLPTTTALARVSKEHVAALMNIALNPVSLFILQRSMEIGLIDAVAARDVDHAELVKVLRGDPSPTAVEMVVELSIELGLVERANARLRASPLALMFLSEGAPVPLRGLIDRHASYLVGLHVLPEALSGMPPADPRLWSLETTRKEQDEYFASRQTYDEASRSYFWDTAALLMRAYVGRDFSAFRVACDVGSGPAAFPALLKRAYPHLRVIAVDPAYGFLEFRARTEDALRNERCEVELRAENALYQPLPSTDLLTMNRVLSGVPRTALRDWLRKAYEALEPGGAIVLVDFFTLGAPEHDGLIASLYALRMGRALHQRRLVERLSDTDYRKPWGWSTPLACDEVARALESVGFRSVTCERADSPFARIEAQKPK